MAEGIPGLNQPPKAAQQEFQCKQAECHLQHDPPVPKHPRAGSKRTAMFQGKRASRDRAGAKAPDAATPALADGSAPSGSTKKGSKRRRRKFIGSKLLLWWSGSSVADVEDKPMHLARHRHDQV